MKSLDNMNNTERAYLFAKLFPQELETIAEFIKKEAQLFRDNEELVCRVWDDGIITVNFWYRLIADFERTYNVNGKRIFKNTRTFSDQLFDGYDALFSIHSLIRYTELAECSDKMRYAIYLLFGESKLVYIDLNNDELNPTENN